MVKPHKSLRDCNKWCSKSGHESTPNGNMHRFHTEGAFKRTHPSYYSGNKLKPAQRNRLKLYARKWRATHKKGKK